MTPGIVEGRHLYSPLQQVCSPRISASKRFSDDADGVGATNHSGNRCPRERETDTDRQRDTERDRETEKCRETDREIQREKQRQRVTECYRETAGPQFAVTYLVGSSLWIWEGVDPNSWGTGDPRGQPWEVGDIFV